MSGRGPVSSEWRKLFARSFPALMPLPRGVSSRVDPALLCLRETLRRLDMRLRPVRSSPAELDAMLAEFHGVRR